MSIRSLSITAILLASAALAVGDAIKIQWKPQNSSVLKYKLSAKANIQGQDMNFGAKVTSKIVEVKTNGNVVVEEKQTDISIKFGDQDFSSMAPQAITSTTEMNPRGETVSRKTDSEQDNPRLEAALEFVYPDKDVNVGDSWTVKRAADSAKGLFSREFTYSYVGDETVGKWTTRKIKVSFKETDAPTNMSVDGTVWVLIEDGSMVKGTFNMKNVEFAPGLPPADSVSEISRID